MVFCPRLRGREPSLCQLALLVMPGGSSPPAVGDGQFGQPAHVLLTAGAYSESSKL